MKAWLYAQAHQDSSRLSGRAALFLVCAVITLFLEGSSALTLSLLSVVVFKKTRCQLLTAKPVCSHSSFQVILVFLCPVVFHNWYLSLVPSPLPWGRRQELKKEGLTQTRHLVDICLCTPKSKDLPDLHLALALPLPSAFTSLCLSSILCSSVCQ